MPIWLSNLMRRARRSIANATGNVRFVIGRAGIAIDAWILAFFWLGVVTVIFNVSFSDLAFDTKTIQMVMEMTGDACRKFMERDLFAPLFVGSIIASVIFARR